MQFQLKPLEPGLGYVLPQCCSGQLPFKASFGTAALSQAVPLPGASPWGSVLWVWEAASDLSSSLSV